MTQINSMTVTFGNGVKREEYGPLKKAEVSLTAGVPDDEDANEALDKLIALAMLKVAEMLDAPKPVIENRSQEDAAPNPPARRGRPKKAEASESTSAAPTPTPEADAESADTPAEDDEWAAAGETIEITDQELLSSLSKRAAELGSRDACIKLIASFSTRTEGPPFKVQEIAQAQRRDFLDKLKALTA